MNTFLTTAIDNLNEQPAIIEMYTYISHTEYRHALQNCLTTKCAILTKEINLFYD